MNLDSCLRFYCRVMPLNGPNGRNGFCYLLTNFSEELFISKQVPYISYSLLLTLEMTANYSRN